jgi:putative membrane protein
MKTIVLCVDRDNDLGVKAGAPGTIIGRSDVISVATKLALSDPEDSDINALFSAVSIYDELNAEGRDVEVVVLCGDVNIGRKADDAVVSRLNLVLDQINPESAVLVSDGAEDEFIYPIVASRIKVERVKRVIVKQTPDIEKVVHTLFQAMKEEKVQRRIYVPLALAFIVLGVFYVTPYPGAGWGAIAIVLGMYFMVRAFNLENNVTSIWRDIKKSLQTSGVSMPFTAIALIFSLTGFIVLWGELASQGWIDINEETLLTFISPIWWWAFAAIIYTWGRVADRYIIEKTFTWSVVIVTFSMLAMGWMSTGSIYMVVLILEYAEFQTMSSLVLFQVFLNYVFGISLASIGWVLHSYIKERIEPPELEEGRPEPQP